MRGSGPQLGRRPDDSSRPDDRTTRPASVRVPVRIRAGRISDVAPLVRMYLGLSTAARYHFHPFPFRPMTATACFATLLAGQHVLPPLHRRIPQSLMRLVVAQVGEGPEIAGYGTIRAVRLPKHGPRVRFGFIVADSFQGHGIGSKIIRSLAETAVAHGFERDIGTVFRSDTAAIRAMAKFNVSFVETEARESESPQEPLFEVHGLLRDKLRLIGPEELLIERPLHSLPT